MARIEQEFYPTKNKAVAAEVDRMFSVASSGYNSLETGSGGSCSRSFD
jgi:uncharacterized membrane protein